MRRCKLDEDNIDFVAKKMCERLVDVLSGITIENPGVCDLSNNAIGDRGCEVILGVLKRFDLQMEVIKFFDNQVSLQSNRVQFIV